MRNRVTCPECRKVIAWPIDNPAGPFCPECGGLIGVVDNKPTERAPMLSDEAIEQWSSVNMGADVKRSYTRPHTNTSYALGAKASRHWYEAKIDSGELRVVKKATWILIGHGYAYCSVCPYWYTMDMDGPPALHNFCPGCGAQIVKE